MLAVILAAVGSLTAADATAHPASAQDRFSFSFSAGDVGLAYRNGFHDRWGRWHDWAGPREMREFRSRYSARYRDFDWDGVPNRYDRDRDGDGVPNYADPRPNRPGGGAYGFYGTRRDWDGDGVPNRFDARPHNPYRW